MMQIKLEVIETDMDIRCTDQGVKWEYIQPSKECPEGDMVPEYYKLEVPELRVSAKLTCKNSFQINKVYASDGQTWIASSEHELIWAGGYKYEFIFPKSVVLIGSVFTPGTGQPN